MDHDNDLFAEDAADPMVTFWTDRFVALKLKSKFKPATWAPLFELKLIGMVTESPGIPEPLPELREALGLWARTTNGNPRDIPTRSRMIPLF